LKISEVKVLGTVGHVCDELFDELVGRWRERPFASATPAVKVDHGGEYEVRVEALVANPRAIDVEVSASNLVVRIPPGARPGFVHAITFAQRVEPEETRARWSDGVLIITLPKQRARRVKVE
jgi:HSP20 family molecular chaperone IbpA